jgi:hypothetical protein
VGDEIDNKNPLPLSRNVYLKPILTWIQHPSFLYWEVKLLPIRLLLEINEKKVSHIFARSSYWKAISRNSQSFSSSLRGSLPGHKNNSKVNIRKFKYLKKLIINIGNILKYDRTCPVDSKGRRRAERRQATHDVSSQINYEECFICP